MSDPSQHPSPRCIWKFLRWFCPDHLYEELSGDLVQRFDRDVRKFGRPVAERKLIWNTIRFFRPGIIFHSKRAFEFRYNYMIRNYFKIAVRSMMKHWVFSAINVFGLAVGIVAFVLILQFVSFETTFDKFHGASDQIYRVAYAQYENGEEKNNSAMNYIGIRQLLKDNFPEVESLTGFSPVPANIGFAFGYNNKTYLESGKLFRADSGFFETFPELLIKGDRSQVLDDTHNLVISEKIARKVFGDEDPVGKHIVDIADHARDGNDYMISGVFKDIPENSHFHTDFVCVMERSWDTLAYYWDAPAFYTYVKVRAGTDPVKIEKRLNNLLSGIEKEHPLTKGARVSFQPLLDIHFYSHLQDELETNGNSFLVYVLFGVGLLILIIAWINYVNLEAARFVTMAREMGIRRIIGSTKRDLVLKVFIKYFCMTLVAIVLASGVLILVIPHFSDITGVPVSNISWTGFEFWLPATIVFVVGSVVMGAYPILRLAKLNPVSSIKGYFTSPARRTFIRRPLAIVQFTASIVLLSFLLVITQQLDFMRLSNKKIDVDKVIVVANALAYHDESSQKREDDFNSFRDKLIRDHKVEIVGSSSGIPGSDIGFTLVNEVRRNQADPYNPQRYKLLFVDYDFIPMYGLKLKAGRNYLPKDVDNDGSTYRLIFNESAIHDLGFKSAEEAIGQTVRFPFWNEEHPEHEIIGVVEDYHHEAIKRPVQPTMFMLNQDKFQQVYFSIRMQAGSDPQEALMSVERTWTEVYPDRPFNYFFLDDHYDQQFKSELYFGRIFGSFAGIAVFLACLGVLGMTLFDAHARLKEISIRKVLGSSVMDLVAFLSRDNIKVMLVSAVIATPLIYLGAERWLSNYPIRIELSFVFFIIPVISILLLVMLMSATQTLKAANTNPVDHLKNE